MDSRQVRKAKSGNKKAFGIIIDEVKIHGYKLAYYYLKNVSDSQDVLCNAIEKAYINIDKIREEENFKQWFLRIVVNEAKMLLRKESSQNTVSIDSINEQSAEEPIAKEETMDLAQSLNQLKEEDRALLMMKYYEGYTFSEIGKMLELPESTVKSRNYTLLKKIREMIRVKEVQHDK